MSMPAQKPGQSKQDYGTPWELIHAVEKRWGKLDVDLAAHLNGDNAKAPVWLYPGEADYLSNRHRDWFEYLGSLGWCNPPFDDIRPWAEKWRIDAENGGRIISLTPLSCSEWFADECEGRAKIVGLRPRIKFEGCVDPYPKDCMLMLWGPGFENELSYSTWRWK